MRAAAARAAAQRGLLRSAGAAARSPRATVARPQPAGHARAVRVVAFQEGDPAARRQQADLAAAKRACRITIFSSAPYVERFLREPIEHAGYEGLEFVEAALDRHTAVLAKGSKVVCVFVNDALDAATLEQLADCGVRLVALRCAGYDRVDLLAAQERGITVARVPTYSPTSVAEHALALAFALNRHIPQAYTRVRAGNYSLTPLVGMELKGKRAGVVGTGAIGTEAVRLFKGIGMDVVAYDIARNPAVEAMGVPYWDLDDLLTSCDVVSLHVPLLESTHHLMNAERISKLKRGCLLLNVSRGGLVSTDAIIDGLEHGSIGGLGMDVYENEADLFFVDWVNMPLEVRMESWDRRFKQLVGYPQVIITPHSAFLTHEALDNIATTTAHNITEFLEGTEPLTNAVRPRGKKAA